MNKNLPTLLATLIWTALYSQHALADLTQQCALGIPVFERPLVKGDPNDLPVHIQADATQANYPENVLFSGNVDILQGNSRLRADQVTLTQEGTGSSLVRTVNADGDVRYDDNLIKLQGPQAWSNLNTRDTDVLQGDYLMVGRQGRGYAEKMKLRENNRYTILENGSFTSCLPGDESWSVVGSEVIYDREESVAEIWNARFKIGSVPVFYSPYLQLPIGDKRRSGFLIPNARYGSSNGFEFTLPYYWNIAPNYDATLTPHYISKRGMQWQNEFRYLMLPGTGLMQFDWLPSDRLYSRSYREGERDPRWLYYWRHQGVMDNVWRFGVDYTRVSDPNYFTDLESAYGSTTDGYATQIFTTGYANQNWDLALSNKRFQIFSDSGNQNAYRAEPQLDLNYFMNDLGPIDLHLYGQVAKFTSVNPNNPRATRWHLEPTLSLPLSNYWASLNTEAKLMATHYQQDNITAYNASRNTDYTLAESVNRVLPQFKADGQLVFERDMALLENYTQTLEPRAQYLLIPYHDQSDIAIYDSTLLQMDYTGLFRDRRYSGLDRISSANRVAAGVTSRIYDDTLTERFNVSVGQIYYLSRPRTGDHASFLNDSTDTGSVVWAGDTYWKIDDRWGVRGGLQYATQLDSLTLADTVLEYRQNSERLVQLSYRYASSDYIRAMLPNITNPLYQNGISQMGVIGSWPIAGRWAAVGGYYYDTNERQSVNQLVGLQYNTCCWSVNMGYERKITDWNNSNNSSIFDNKISFNIELRGLSSNHSLGSQEMLRSGIMPYQRAF